MKTRVKASIAVLALVVAASIVLVSPRLRAQVSSIVGFVQPTNYLAPTSGEMSSVGGVVTNPSGLVAQVSGGTAFCQGSQEPVPQVQLTLTASTTYLLVYNCQTQQVYAKTAVTGPGSQTGQPGVPNTALFAQYPEIPINTVVAGASSLTLTDARVPGQWAIGAMTGTHLITPSANGDVAGTCVLGTSCAITFAIPYQSAPACVATDTTSAAATKAVTSGGPPVTTLTITGTSTDHIAYICVGNPN